MSGSDDRSLRPPVRTLWWEDGALMMLDQSLLPAREKTLRLTTVEGIWRAIRELKVRGAPAIGVAAAYGMLTASLRSRARTGAGVAADVRGAGRRLRACRPTAYNLFYAVDRMERAAAGAGPSAAGVRAALAAEASRIFAEDLECGRRIGGHGARLVADGSNCLTHCNAGGLATAGFGTALAVFFAARRAGRRFHVYVDETRPVLQGARLTAWELGKVGIPHTLICDNMAGSLMARGKVDLVVVGADRIAANGDTANKIGTYPLAVLARHHRVPFYVAAPSTTFDPSIPDGGAIPIEERDPDEVRAVRGVRLAPAGVAVYNPAFDVTPARYIAGFVTEKGVLPARTACRRLFS